MEEIAVLIVDDSALMRNLISRMITGVPGCVVAGKAMNGEMALGKIDSLKPDIIILDLEMPIMTGVEFMRERKKRGIDIPVIILSSIARQGAAVTMECLELGASDFLLKPSGSESEDITKVADRLADMVICYGAPYAKKHQKKLDIKVQERLALPLSERTETVSTQRMSVQSRVTKPAVIQPLREPGKIEIIALGISTGGPNALREVFSQIVSDLPQPIVVVQHMPVGFTAEFAASLNNICPLEVKEAADGDLLKRGRILIAPGNKHVVVEKRPLASILRLSDEPQRNGHRPSADVLFESVAKVYQNHALGIIMTGMGRDGATELTEMRKQGAWTLGQDAESSVVYGMPRVAYEMGAVMQQVSLSKMAETINTLAKSHC